MTPGMRTPVSVALIAKDAARTLERALASVAWADDIIVILDDRTTDDSALIAQRAGARLERHTWKGHVAQKNIALAAARYDWVLALDADEEVSPELRVALLAWREHGGDAAMAGYVVARRSQYLGRWIRHGGWYPDAKLRLADRRRARWTGLDPHDRLAAEGATGCLAGDLLHDTYASVADHLARSESYSSIAAAALFAVGRRASWADILLRPPWRFVQSYVLRAGFLDGYPGFVIAAVGSMGVLAKYLKLRECGRSQTGEPSAS